MKKVLFVILCNKEGPVMQIPVPKGKPVTGNFYKNVVIKILKKWYETCRLKTGVKFLRRMHDKAPSHNERNVTEAEKAFVLPNPLFLQSKPHAFCLKYHLFGKRCPWVCNVSVYYVCPYWGVWKMFSDVKWLSTNVSPAQGKIV